MMRGQLLTDSNCFLKIEFCTHIFIMQSCQRFFGLLNLVTQQALSI